MPDDLAEVLARLTLGGPAVVTLRSLHRIAPTPVSTSGAAPLLSHRDAAGQIGCIMLAGTFFFDEADWIEPPASFAKNIVRYKAYDHGEAEGARLWEQVQERLRPLQVAETRPVSEDADLYGDPVLVRRRLGQGSFRAVVSDTYSWRAP